MEKKWGGKRWGRRRATWGMDQPKISGGRCLLDLSLRRDKGSSRTLKGALSQFSPMVETQMTFLFNVQVSTSKDKTMRAQEHSKVHYLNSH